MCGVVPAAGASRRMGSPKGLLDLDGVPFVRHVVGSLAAGGCVPVLVVTAPGDRATASAAADAGARVLVNPDPGEGPITSLRLAIAELAGSDAAYLAYLPIDHPRVSAATVAALLAAVRAHRPPLALPVHRGSRGHPALFARTLFAELSDPGLGGGARTVVHRHLEDALLVETEDPGVLLDVDTPDEYRELLRAGRSGAAGGHG